MEGTVGEIRMFAGNFAPRTWAFCQGQLVAIQSNTALFSILGSQYGGNGTVTFGLPNFAGRVVIGSGQGRGLSTYDNGEIGGTANQSVLTTEMPAHVHSVTFQQPITGTVTLNGATGGGNTTQPDGALISGDGSSSLFAPGGGNTAPMANTSISVSGNFSITPPTVSAVSVAGGSVPHNNIQPYLGMNYLVCMYGVFPARN